ncbi:hypothetical protein V8F06_003592 [Rhypophila decipiens]
MSSDPVVEAILRLFNEFREFDQEAHTFCPKINDDDFSNYNDVENPDEDDGDTPGATSEQKKERIEAANLRHINAYNLSLLLAIPREDASTWLDEWKNRVEHCLSTCDECVRAWHKSRERFLRHLEEELPKERVDYLEQVLNQFDKERIDRGLKKARAILEEFGPMTSSKLVERDVSAVLALFEALCCMPYLAYPENRENFNYVFEKTQQKRPLKMQGGIIPTMVFFLFDENPYRRKFAEAAWERLQPGALSEEDWDWAVNPQLSAAITSISIPPRGTPTPEKISRFWGAVPLMLRAMSKERILNSLRAMEVNPSIYYLALENLATHSGAALVEVLKGLKALMEKSEDAFWAAYEQLTPSILVEEIVKSPAFRPYLDRSLVPDNMIEEGNHKVPILAAFMKALIRSLPNNRRSDVVESILRHLVDGFAADPNATQEARATCILAGLAALSESLDGFLNLPESFDTGTSLIMVNQLLNRVVQYQKVIIDSADLRPGDSNVGRLQAAMGIIQSALALDSKATRTEWEALAVNSKRVQDAVTRDSGALWEAFLELLWTGQVELAKAMLLATMPLRDIEQFLPPRKEKLDRQQERFNQRYQQQTAAIGKMLNRLTDFAPADLDMLCSEPQSQTIHPIVASLIHGEDGIREAGFELVKAITGETDPSEAINKMVEAYFSPFLGAFCGAVNAITRQKEREKLHLNPWAHMRPTLKCSKFILTGLCDPSVGQLRLRTLTPGEHAVVKQWWETSWHVVGHSFGMMRTWHEKVAKVVMENFCRDVMELAEALLAQDGLMASALTSNAGGSPPPEDTAKSMEEVLGPPNRYSPNLVYMLQLRDGYLIRGIMDIVKKLLGRNKENNMVLPPKTVAELNAMLKKSKMSTGKVDYPKKTNLSNEQRIELLKAMGEDAEIELQFIGSRPVEKEAPKKQIKLDFSKAGGTSYGSLNDHISAITPNFEKSGRRSTLDSLKVEAPPPPKPKLDPKAVLANQLSIKEKRAKEKAEIAKRNAEIIAKAKALRAPPKLVPGEGSGLAGIAGVKGKDLTPAAKDEIMVGSSSESESDSDDDEEDLPRRKVGPKFDASRRLLTERGPVKKMKLQRSAKDMRARLIPPMDVLHQAILEWDIFHEGNDPPNGYRCAAVANSYTDPRSYKEAFFPLLVNEAWRSFVTAKDEATSRPFGVTVLNRMTVDKFMEITASVPAPTGKDRGLSEGDIIIISKAEDPLTQPGEAHCLARIWKTNFKKDVMEVVCRLNAKGNQILSVLLPGSTFHVVKITNMITIEREYAALESLQYYDLMDEVLKAEPSPMLKFGDEAIQGVMKNYNLNPGQAKAILNAKENDGFTLVQGPPGTGKTKTIIAMVGCLLTSVLKNASNGAVAISRPGMPQSKRGGTLKKLLVCAPSNAAVDELVLRLKEGVKTSSGSFHKINVVRLGRSDAINAAVRDVTIDELVKAKIESNCNGDGNGDAPSDREKLHKEAGEIKQKLNDLYPPLEAARNSGDRPAAMKIQREIDELKRRRAHINTRIESEKSEGNTFARETEIKRRQVQQEILDNAHVLCATLSGSGHEMFKNLNVEFETVIIDEAAQCVELSALIPLKYGCSKCILVGDPKQLPPTVLSQSAAKYGYDQSLFVRMQKNHGKEIHLLDMQYRMHPEISMFPSREFYEGLLQDGANMAKLRLQPWHESALLGPYRFFDVKGSQSKGPRNQSLVNEQELQVAMQLYNRFKSDYHGVDLKGKIGIITPYKAQLFRLRQRFADRYGDAINEEIEFNTTDAFQGRECEIIIFSCVRASPTGGIGFMTDIRRMNVGLTRAKSSLWILGDSRALVQGEFWAKLIEDARKRDRYTSGDVMGMLSRPGPKLSPAALAALGTSSAPALSRGSSAASTPREIVEIKEDVEMPDAPPVVKQEDQKQLPSRFIDHERMPPPVQNRAPRTGGFNERGEATFLPPRGAGPPIIQTSVPVKKRTREESSEDDKVGVNKKVCTAPPGQDSA